MVGTSVVYLIWAPLGVAPLERFAASYRAHPPGIEHQLVLVLKGTPDVNVASRSAALAREFAAETVPLADSGMDLDTYAISARQLETDTICFLNSASEILAPGWLASLQCALERPQVALAGATGSYESALSSAPRPLKPFLRRVYPPFPNPHVRTNAFILQRELMLSLFWPSSGRKRRALELESGARSITRQVHSRGLKAVVVDRDGGCFEPEQWPQSRTFRSGEQDQLLIADNRTRQYADASPARRAELAQMAWGDGAALIGSPVAAEP